MSLVEEVYLLTDKLPKTELYGLSSQIRRAAVSVPSCIAEGSKKISRKDYVHFLKMSEGSAMEIETQLILIERIYKLETHEILSLLEEIQKMLSVMISKLTPKP